MIDFNTPAWPNNSDVGRQVRVIRSTKCYGDALKEKSGIVRRVLPSGGLGVEIFGEFNPRSAGGLFWLTVADLVFVYDEDIKNKKEGEEKTMNKIDNYINIAEVQFLDTKDPFRSIECANYEPDLKAGDVCVVKTARHGMALAEVIDIKSAPGDGEVLREVVSIVDTTRYDERVAKREKAAELKAKMQERAKQLQDVVLYQTLAKSDPEMAQMLQEFLDIVDPSKEG